MRYFTSRVKLKYGKDKAWVILIGVAFLFFIHIFILKNSHHSFKYTLELKEPIISNLTNAEPMPVEKDYSNIQKESPSLQVNAKLLGTIVGEPTVAFIADLDLNYSRTFRVGDKICGARIVKIADGHVIIEKEGLRGALYMQGGMRLVENDVEGDMPYDKIMVSRSYMRSQMDKLNGLLAKMAISPVPDPATKKLKGFRVDNVPQGSIVEQIGLKSGDIVHSVEGEKIESTRDAIQAFSNVKNKSDIDVTLLRNGEPVTLKYRIAE